MSRYYKQRGGGALTSALAPVAKDIATQVAIEAAKLGMDKLTNKLGITKKRPPPKRRRRKRGGQRKRTRQQGGALPLAALIPLALAGGKAIAKGALSSVAGHGVKKGIQALQRRRAKRR